MVSGAGRGAGQQATLVYTQQKSGVTETSVCLKGCLIYDSAIQRSNPTGLEPTRLVIVPTLSSRHQREQLNHLCPSASD